jgi:hypothetical protein
MSARSPGDDGSGTVSGPSLRAAEMVERLWADVARRQARGRDASVPELGPTPRLIHDPDLLYLNSHRDIGLGELLDHLIPLLNSFAERRDELVAEVRLLREAVVAESERLAERDDVLHRLVESRVEQIERDLPGPG